MTFTMALEMRTEPRIQDVTEDGVEIPEPTLTPAERLAENISKINVFNIRRTAAAVPDTPAIQTVGSADEMEVEKESGAPAEVDVGIKPPPVERVRERVYYAREEIKLLCDIVTRLIDSAHQKPDQPDLLHLRLAHAPRRQPANDAKQIDDLRLAINAKDEDLRQIAAYLKSSAEGLVTNMERENRFYGDFSLKLRQHDWILQSRGGRPGLPRALYLDYGFRHGKGICTGGGEGGQGSSRGKVVTYLTAANFTPNSYFSAGSTFSEIGEADVWRDLSATPSGDAVSADNELEIVVPHRRPKKVLVVVVPTAGAGGVGDAAASESGVFKKLASAQSTIFETELFNEILKEATTGEPVARSARVTAKAVIVPISDEESLRVDVVDLQRRASCRSRR
ncbi:hypothetical protein BDK51DRAFT_32060, partial [Blyttiomyces helicus]